jgi:hypothetical protein
MFPSVAMAPTILALLLSSVPSYASLVAEPSKTPSSPMEEPTMVFSLTICRATVFLPSLPNVFFVLECNCSFRSWSFISMGFLMNLSEVP